MVSARDLPYRQSGWHGSRRSLPIRRNVRELIRDDDHEIGSRRICRVSAIRRQGRTAPRGHPAPRLDPRRDDPRPGRPGGLRDRRADPANIRALPQDARPERPCAAQRRSSPRCLPSRLALVVRSFSYFSHLANIAEDAHHRRRTRAHAVAGSKPRIGTVRRALDDAKAAGITRDELQTFFDNAFISPVLTAHPTEVRRRSTMDWEIALARRLDIYNQRRPAAGGSRAMSARPSARPSCRSGRPAFCAAAS